MKTFILAGALAALATAVPAAAQDAAPPQAPKTASKEQVEAAVKHFSIMNGVLTSEKAPKLLKDSFFSCLYGAPLGAISERATEIVKMNEKLSAENPQHQMVAIALACGVTPQQLATLDPAKGE